LGISFRGLGRKTLTITYGFVSGQKYQLLINPFFIY